MKPILMIALCSLSMGGTMQATSDLAELKTANRRTQSRQGKVVPTPTQAINTFRYG